MKLLLTSSGISNASIHDALVELLGKPIAESSALCIPTGIYPFPGGPEGAYRLIAAKTRTPLVGLGWKSMGVFELTALPSIDRNVWVDAVRTTDALLVWGGDVVYLSRWMRESGLADVLPTLSDMVYVGVSAGSMIAASTFGETYGEADRPFVIEQGLGLVDFALLPHMDEEDHPESTAAKVQTMAAHVRVPTYGIDDATAIKVVDGAVDVISEGHWQLFHPCPPPADHGS